MPAGWKCNWNRAGRGFPGAESCAIMGISEKKTQLEERKVGDKMADSVIMLALGILICVFGAVNITGNISTIHWYNRRKVSEEDVPKYGRAVGIGTLIIGASLIAAAVLQLVCGAEASEYIVLAGLAIGCVIILCAQFKYNKGIF